MRATDIQDIGNLKKLDVPIVRITVTLRTHELRITTTTAYWESINCENLDDKLEAYVFEGESRITEAVDHYNKVTGAYKHD